MQQSKYFYKGIPISIYCKEHEMNLKTIRSRISKKKNDPKYSDYTEQQIVDMVIESYGTNIKYMYNGISLRQYCLKNNINYETISSRIASVKKEDPNLPNDQIVKKVLIGYKNSNLRLFYKDIPLKKYCDENKEINYNQLRYFIYDELDRNPNISVDEIVDIYLVKEHKGRYKYYYCGFPLIVYCEKNNINYDNVLRYMSRHTKEDFDRNLSTDEYVEIIMNQYSPFELKYQFQGISLRQYCLQNNLLYDSVKTFVRRKLQLNSELCIDDLIKEAINTIKRYGIIYYYSGIPLIDYCKEKNLNYDSIASVIRNKKTKSTLCLQDIINITVQNYKKNLEIKKIRNIFEILKQEVNISLEEVENICDFLKISYNNVLKLVHLNYSVNQAINMIWFFGDSEEANNKKMITARRVGEILKMTHEVKESNIERMYLYDLIGLYKCDLYNTLSAMIIRQKGFLKKVVISLSREYNLTLSKDNFDFFENEVIYYFITAINRAILPNAQQIIKYIDRFVKGSFRIYLKKVKQEMNCISLNQLQYNSTKQSNHSEKIDYIKGNFINDLTSQASFSKEMMSILKELNEDDLNFVILKFQKQYSNEELANYFNISINEVIEKENLILTCLRNNDKVRLLKRNLN